MNQQEHDTTEDLLARLDGGDRTALSPLISLHRNYLKKVIDSRMEEDLRRRIDPSDVVQEAQLAASQRLDYYLEKRPARFRIWLRSTALERLVDLRRRHLAEKRSVRRDRHLSDASSMALARHLLDGRPSQQARRKELAKQVREAIFELADIDREILTLRQIEELSNAEVAEVLQIEPATSRKRLGRAMIRLTEVLSQRGIQLDER